MLDCYCKYKSNDVYQNRKGNEENLTIGAPWITTTTGTRTSILKQWIIRLLVSHFMTLIGAVVMWIQLSPIAENPLRWSWMANMWLGLFNHPKYIPVAKHPYFDHLTTRTLWVAGFTYVHTHAWTILRSHTAGVSTACPWAGFIIATPTPLPWCVATRHMTQQLWHPCHTA